ncbi:hypothetical protein PM082_012607 [Marasmius tenuissimus]|nr:hypothetical protein PM082_012607 [Marasmius tenuissimus]
MSGESEAKAGVSKVLFPNLTPLRIRDVQSARHLDYGISADMTRLFFRMAESSVPCIGGLV